MIPKIKGYNYNLNMNVRHKHCCVVIIDRIIILRKNVISNSPPVLSIKKVH